IVNYLHDTRQAAGVPPDQIYGPIFYTLAGLLVVGFIANLLVRPVERKWHMKKADVYAEKTKQKSKTKSKPASAPPAAGTEALTRDVALFWLLVGVPLAWGIWMTLEKALVLFR